MRTSLIVSYLAAAAMLLGSGFAAPVADAALDAIANAAPDAPAGDLVPLEVLEAEAESLQARDMLEKRAICQFGGDRACSIKCFALKAPQGGYCNSRQVCICNRG